MARAIGEQPFKELTNEVLRREQCERYADVVRSAASALYRMESELASVDLEFDEYQRNALSFDDVEGFLMISDSLADMLSAIARGEEPNRVFLTNTPNQKSIRDERLKIWARWLGMARAGKHFGIAGRRVKEILRRKK